MQRGFRPQVGGNPARQPGKFIVGVIQAGNDQVRDFHVAAGRGRRARVEPRAAADRRLLVRRCLRARRARSAPPPLELIA